VKNILKYVLSAGLAAGLLWYTLRDYDFGGISSAMGQISWGWVLASVLLTFLAHISRAIRWQMLLEPIGYRPSLKNTTLSVLMGYFANNLFPRLGEVTRCGTLTNTESIPLEKSFGTVVTERIIDVLLMLAIFGLNFLLEFDRLSAYFLGFFSKKNTEAEGSNKFMYIGLLIVALIAMLYWQRQRILASNIGQKILNLLKGFTEGIMSVFKLRNPWAFVGHSLLIWFCYYLSTYTIFLALPSASSLGPLAALSTLSTGALGVAAPTPGGLGAYHALVSSMLEMYGLGAQQGKTLAIILHGSQMIITLAMGVVAMMVLFLQKKK
jgi:glycosyltransferase 2 family protein